LFLRNFQHRIESVQLKGLIGMKLRILSYRLTATHSSITSLSTFNDPVSISDFDAFVFDPDGLHSDNMSTEIFIRRQVELQDLVQKKAGIVICILRPNASLSVPGVNANRYTLLERIAPQIVSLVNSTVRPGQGSQVTLVQSARGASSGYFRVLKGNLRFAAHLETAESRVSQHSGKIFAVNSVGYPIAAEFPVGQGVLSFVPIPHEVTGDRMGAAITKTITAHFNRPTEIDAPSWTAETFVPGAHVHDERIAEVGRQREQLAIEISELERKRDELLNYQRLLFGYGKALLEPMVRAALRLLGFVAPDPEEYRGEWDVELHESQSGRTAIGEVEGSEGPIDIDKYRQLLDYVEAEGLDGRNHKGILIGNGFRLTPPDAPERQRQFSDHVLRGAKMHQFCLLPTTELFKAVCAVLETPENEGLKIKIRDSFLTTVGVWTFIS
jgi:hypothetical protein